MEDNFIEHEGGFNPHSPEGFETPIHPDHKPPKYDDEINVELIVTDNFIEIIVEEEIKPKKPGRLKKGISYLRNLFR
jgi:hypothetical protein